jgi:glyoxylase-like metal-dependent hydrolase (beta-lactamase superfamily II)/rhodanese-related sulfurtransferase
MYSEQFFVEGLACASYLIGCDAQGVAAVVDPDRKVDKYLTAAANRSLKITHIIETHLHADHVSGNTDLAARIGAGIYIHESAGAEFAHNPLRDGDTIWLGNVRLDIRHTPGHTPDSITMLVGDTTRADEAWLALTGDTLFVGDIGRPDLVGPDEAQVLAEQMYDSLFNKLLELDDGLLIYPGHGAGSLCGKSIGAMRATTLGYERRFNPALTERTKPDFINFAISELPEQPGNHTRIKALNRRGPRPLGEVKPLGLTIRAAVPHFRRGAALVDTRTKADYVERHVPGAVHLEADDQLSNQIGFVLMPDVPIILQLANESDYNRVVYSLARVGYESVIGYLTEGLSVWEELGFQVASGDIEDLLPQSLYAQRTKPAAEQPVILDVRENWEYRQGHVPESIHIPLGDLVNKLDTLDPEQPVAVICATGSRSQTAAALLGRRKFKKIYNVTGGITAWAQAGLPVEQ